MRRLILLVLLLAGCAAVDGWKTGTGADGSTFTASRSGAEVATVFTVGKVPVTQLVLTLYSKVSKLTVIKQVGVSCAVDNAGFVACTNGSGSLEPASRVEVSVRGLNVVCNATWYEATGFIPRGPVPCVVKSK